MHRRDPAAVSGIAANSGKRGTLEVHTEWSTANNNGTVTSPGAEVIIDGTAFGTCTFTTEAGGTDIGTLTGSKNLGGSTATFDIDGSIASPCGTGTWEGSYKIVTPDYLDVD